MQGEAVEILLVEDDPDHAELIIRGLQGNGIANRINHVSDGEAALNYLFRRGEYADVEKSHRPHLVLLDLRLPRIDGLEVLRELKADQGLRSIPVVVLTTSNAHTDRAAASALYVNSYLVKPDDFPEYQKLIDDLGNYWMTHNQPYQPNW